MNKTMLALLATCQPWLLDELLSILDQWMAGWAPGAVGFRETNALPTDSFYSDFFLPFKGGEANPAARVCRRGVLDRSSSHLVICCSCSICVLLVSCNPGTWVVLVSFSRPRTGKFAIGCTLLPFLSSHWDVDLVGMAVPIASCSLFTISSPVLLFFRRSLSYAFASSSWVVEWKPLCSMEHVHGNENIRMTCHTDTTVCCEQRTCARRGGWRRGGCRVWCVRWNRRWREAWRSMHVHVDVRRAVGKPRRRHLW